MFTYISSLSASERQVFQIFDHFRSIHVVSFLHFVEPLDITNLAQNGVDDSRGWLTPNVEKALEKALGSSAGQEQGRDRWGLFDISIVATSKSAPY